MRKLYISLLVILYSAIGSTPVSAQFSWSWGAGTSGNDADVFGAAIDDSANVYISGKKTYAGFMNLGSVILAMHYSGGFIAKCDSSGHYMWAVGADSASGSSVYDVAVDHNGYTYMIGNYAYGKVAIGTWSLRDPGYSSSTGPMMYMAKINPGGHVIWARNIMRPYVYGNFKIRVDKANKVYMVGNYWHATTTIGSFVLHNTDSVASEIFLAKFDSSGTARWATTMGSNYDDNVDAMAVTDSGNVFLQGAHEDIPFQVGSFTLTDPYATAHHEKFYTKFDSSGHCLWARNMSRHILLNDMTADSMNNVYMTGSIDTSIIVGTDTLGFVARSEVIIEKTDPSGNPVWARAGIGDSLDQGQGICVDKCGNVFVCGGMDINGFYGHVGYTLTFDGHILSNPGSPDPLFLVQYNASGHYIQGSIIYSGGDDYAALLASRYGEIYLAGDAYQHTTTIFGRDTIAPTDLEDAYIAKFRNTSEVCSSPEGFSRLTGTNPPFTLYPNPASRE